MLLRKKMDRLLGFGAWLLSYLMKLALNNLFLTFGMQSRLR